MSPFPGSVTVPSYARAGAAGIVSSVQSSTRRASRDRARTDEELSGTDLRLCRILRAVGVILAAHVAVSAIEELEHGGDVFRPPDL
jgi:hypothetical protein